jgi:hypothetical protein
MPSPMVMEWRRINCRCWPGLGLIAIGIIDDRPPKSGGHPIGSRFEQSRSTYIASAIRSIMPKMSDSGQNGQLLQSAIRRERPRKVRYLSVRVDKNQTVVRIIARVSSAAVAGFQNESIILTAFLIRWQTQALGDSRSCRNVTVVHFDQGRSF